MAVVRKSIRLMVELSDWMLFWMKPSDASKQPKRRPRLTPAELEAAYREAAGDPTFIDDMKRINSRFENTVSDGFGVAAR